MTKENVFRRVRRDLVCMFKVCGDDFAYLQKHYPGRDHCQKSRNSLSLLHLILIVSNDRKCLQMTFHLMLQIATKSGLLTLGNFLVYKMLFDISFQYIYVLQENQNIYL